MAALKVSILLLVLVAQCWTTPLEVLVVGVEYTGTGFCVGDNVSFTCNIPSNSHQWSVDGFRLGINRFTPLPAVGGPDDRFILSLARPLPNDSIISTLSVITYSGFNGLNITCVDATVLFAEQQTSIAAILGPPSAPDVRPFTRVDFLSFIVSLSTVGPSARCVTRYFLTIIENGEPLTTMTIIGSNGFAIADGLNLCKNVYTFTAVALTNVISGGSSDPVAGLMNFTAVSILSDVRVANGVVQWTISSSLPGECYGSYSLRLSQCTIQEFAILPAVNLTDDAVREIFAGISAATPQNSMTTMISSSFESVDIGNCDRPTLRTSITPANISGHLVLSSASTEASTSLCNISLMAGSVTSTSSLVTGCNTIGSGGGGDGGDGGNGGGGDGGGGGGSSGALIGGVIGGIAVAVLLILVVFIVVLVVLLSKKASKPEVKERGLPHDSPTIQMNNPIRNPGDSTIPLPLYEECGPLYGNNDAIMQQKAPEAASVGQNFGDYEFTLCKAYGVHNKADEMMEEVCYDEVVTPGEGY